MKKTRALIVDDDHDTANLFSTVLSLVGFECVIINSARAALAYLAANEPDIVLLDMRLGLEISGNDILYQIRSNPRFDKMRVIVITAYPQMAEPVHDLADLVMLKPVEVESLSLLATRFTSMQPQSYLFRDPVTRLFSYKFFFTRLELAVERMKRRSDFLFAVMAIAFEVAPAGVKHLLEEDQESLLKAVADRLRKGFRPTDTFGRLDNERFIALFEDLNEQADADAIIRRLQMQLSGGYLIRERSVEINLYIGALLSDPRYPSADACQEAATRALEYARSSSAGGYYFA